jgi:ribosome biogenesis GTPase
MAKRKGKARQRINWDQRFDAGKAQDDFAPRQKLSHRGIKIPAGRVAAEQENVELLPKREGMVMGLFPGGAIVRTTRSMGVPPMSPTGVSPVSDSSPSFVSSLEEQPQHEQQQQRHGQDARETHGQDAHATPHAPVRATTQLICSIAKMFRAPEGSTALAVGDNVTVALSDPEHVSGQTQDDKDRADGMILLRHPRSTALSRPELRSGKHTDPYSTETFEKVIVANMDVLLIVASTVQPPLRHGLIDRFMIAAERGELKPVLVINKIDLAPPDADVLDDFTGLGLEILKVSAASGMGIGALQKRLAGCRSVLAGPSGVGKSTLVNALVPGAAAVTGMVRLKDQRGRHTTASANVYDLPGGGTLVDTPGVRELGVRMDAAELSWYFPEFAPFAPGCKFRDCTHTHEPQCAVRDAVEQSKILPRRYGSYVRILETIQ